VAISTQTHQLLELINHYPSPHNGQPIVVELVDKTTLRLYFDRARGLQATDISYLFSYVSMGVFAEHLQLSGKALGHEIALTPTLPKESELRGEGLVPFAQATVKWDASTPDGALQGVLEARQTSRKKYFEGPDAVTAKELETIAAEESMSLVQLDAKATQQAIWLNQRAVFDDLFDEPVRQELNHWLRYSKAEKETKRDGLSYDCMQINGGAMKYVVNHPKLLRTPGIGPILKQYYLRTMKDSSSVFYMLAPFQTEEQSYEIGRVVMRIWKRVAEKGYSLHPFGTIMSNVAAHKDFAQIAGIEHESREKSYLVFIFRMGKSKPAVRSERIPYQEHLLKKESTS